MKTVRMNKAELAEILTANKEKHTKAYQEAYDGFLNLQIKRAKKILKQAEKRKKVMIHDIWRDVAAEPNDYTADYQRAIDMLGHEVDEVVVLTNEEYDAYVNDVWDWTGHFEAASMNYGKFSRR